MGIDESPDSGFTLVEVLIAVVIMGIAFAALLGGMATSTLTSDIHRKQALAAALLSQAAESVKDDNRNAYSNAACTGVAVYNPYTGVSLPPGWALAAGYQPIKVLSVQYWDGATFQPTCTLGEKLQLIRLKVASPDGRAEESVGVVKRAP